MAADHEDEAIVRVGERRADVKPGDIGQPDVKHDDVGLIGIGKLEALGAARGYLHLVTGALENRLF